MPRTRWDDAKHKAQEEAAYKFIASTVEERGYPPSIRELADHLGYQSTANAHAVLVRMQRAGRVVRAPGQPRAITLVPADEEAS